MSKRSATRSIPSRRKSSAVGRSDPRFALQSAKLYLILDTEVCGYERLFKVAREAVLSGVGILQLRDKKGSAKEMTAFAKSFHEFLNQSSLKVPLIMNDRVDVALAGGCAGVHLGQDDLDVCVARRILGPQALIGISCQTLEHVQSAQSQGADYIGFGSVFKTKTKPHRQEMDLALLQTAFQLSTIPVFAIGGINENNARTLSRLGIDRIAVCRALCESENISSSTRKFLSTLGALGKDT